MFQPLPADISYPLMNSFEEPRLLVGYFDPLGVDHIAAASIFRVLPFSPSNKLKEGNLPALLKKTIMCLKTSDLRGREA